MWAFVLGCLATQAKAYPSVGWPMYGQQPREYLDDDYYYAAPAPKAQYYYGAPAARSVQEVYGRVPYPYYYDTYGHYADEDPVRQDERLAALPVGQETWYESETEPTWRSSDLDDVNAAFLDNLILTQMARDAQRRREYARNNQALPPTDYQDEEEDIHELPEDEDVRELKALAGKPLYHSPKTAPHFDDDDYPADDAFINWNGNKRSVSTPAPTTTRKPKLGQDEIMVPRPAQIHHHTHNEEPKQNKKDSVYEKITQLLAAESKSAHNMVSLFQLHFSLSFPPLCFRGNGDVYETLQSKNSSTGPGGAGAVTTGHGGRGGGLLRSGKRCSNLSGHVEQQVKPTS